MKIRTLILENFGPYFGTQTVELLTDSVAPVVLVHGENGRGKTSIFHGIRWCLYDNVTSHAGEKLTIASFANWDMRDKGEEFPVSVTLVMNHGGQTYTLKRWATCQVDRTDPMKSRALHSGVSLIDGSGKAFPVEEIRDQINEILNEGFADLFLFDAETLSTFEARLTHEQQARDLVRDSIEKSLGLTAFNTLTADLKEIRDQTDKDLTKTLKGWNAAKNIVDKRDAAQTKLDAAIRNREQVLRDVQTALATKERLKPVIEANASFADKQRRREELVREIDVLEGEVKEYRQRITAALKTKFWLPCNGDLQKRVAALRQQVEQETQRALNAARVEIRQDDINASLSSGCCILCDQGLSESSRQRLQGQIDAVVNAQQASAKQQALLDGLRRTLKELESFADAATAFQQIKDWDAEVRPRLINIERAKLRRDELTDELKAVSSDYSKTEAEYEEAVAIILNADKAMPLLDSTIEELQAEVNTLRGQVRKMTDDGSPQRKKLDVIENLIKIYEAAIAQFRGRMRTEVQTVASSIFKSLTTEPDYQGLRIDNNYYLRIVDGNDRVVPRRSAGNEQIVALALIGALAECAVREAPLIIDTPMGRLDQGHRRNVLKWLPSVGEQVLLFATSGEYDEGRDRAALGNGLGREYDMVRITAWHTEIRRHSNV